MSTPPREQLELEKFRQEILTELSRRHNWEAQERNWRWQQWILLGSFIVGVLGVVLRVWP